ncbi:MAG: FAD-dependent oxidoreductase [Acidimicrobiia bacterium]|nr:FAD-dependent oxidoreductase [Acidimicrobiia bacterium]
MRDPRYDILFEPVPIGPVTARNRFFQVPHCNGMGYRDPTAVAEMRGVKAEGGWAVVCTEETEIHHSSDLTPSIEGRLWDDADIPAMARSAERIHDHDGLAGIELVYNGMHMPNYYTRLAPMGPAHLPVIGSSYDPVQARRMSKDDIADLRRWHRAAVRRSIIAGFDLAYVYAGHNMTGLHHFLSPRYNQRTDEYGGSLENRMRLLRELIEDAMDEAAGQAAIAVRITVDELIGDTGITRPEIEEVIGTLGELPDLWDFVPGSWSDDSVTSRFSPEGHQEEWVKGLKQLTSKPVVGVGRFTSPDTMVRMVQQGVLDFIGAARPSIADPFLPQKIEEGRLEDIRECIGCNICVSGDLTMSPIRCTQNPAMGEEWRRGWHPERIRPKGSDAKVMVVGAGPAGLEAAQALGKRGYQVVMVERSRRLGGRVATESRLPGLAAWIRVVDYRETQLRQLDTVEHYFESDMTADELLTYDFTHVAVATGSTWRRDGVGRWHTRPMPIDDDMEILTPDDLMAGKRPRGNRVVLFDDDGYYLGGVLAELLDGEGFAVVLVTPAAAVSAWTVNTLEQHRIQRKLMEMGVEIKLSSAVTEVNEEGVTIANTFTGREASIACHSVVSVTARLPNEPLFDELEGRRGEWEAAGLKSVRAIGDAWAPGTIAAAVWDGHRYAEELDTAPNPDGTPFRREAAGLSVRPEDQRPEVS